MKYLTYWGFFWGWVGRAFSDAANFFKLDWRTSLTSAFLVILGFTFYWKIKGTAALKDEVVKFLLTTAAPAAFFLTGLIIYSLWRAPYKIYVEEQQVATGKLDDMTGRATRAERSVAEDAKTIDKLRGELAAQSTKPRPVGPSADENARQQRKQIRDTIAKLMEDGNTIAAACLISQEKPELVTQANDWARRSYTYLQSVDAGNAARFNAAGGPSYLNPS